MNIDEFMHGLDMLYKNQKYDQVEEYLLSGLEKAGDSEEAIVILNDLMGYYRAVSRHEDMVEGAKRVLGLINKMKLEDTISHGTSLLNIATGYRAAGKYEEAEKNYYKAANIFEQCIKGPDYRVATLYNNLGILYIQTGRPELAKESILKALEMTLKLSNTKVELASTYANLGNVCFMLRENKEAEEYMKKSVAIYESLPGHMDSHYPAALAGLGQASFVNGELDKSVAYYERALELIESMYGRNDDWKTTYSNLQTVMELVNRRDSIKMKGMKGMELSKLYFREVGIPMLESKYAQYLGRIAVGLVGEGSECLGFDDEYSTDHDFGPGFCIWLTKEDYEKIGGELQRDYDALPKSFHGIPVRNTTKEGAGRVGVLCMEEFFKKYTGYTKAPEAKNINDVLYWSIIPKEMLRTATNGKVFYDGLGEFTARRKSFEKYPEAVRLYMLSDALHRMAQSGQYNYIRGRKRKDIGIMYNSLSKFVEAASEAAYLLNNKYMPFYKWSFKAMEEFTCLTDMKEDIEELIDGRPDKEGMEEKIENICHKVLKELHRQKLSNSNEEFLDIQKDEVLRKMNENFENKTNKEKLVEEIVKLEWNQFQHVENEGGRAECQDNYETFYIMRASQFLAWDEEVLESYLDDLKEGNKIGWNLITEKYARMMEYSSPERYAELEKHLPKINDQRKALQEALVSISVQWTKEVDEKYPHIAGIARSRTTEEDTKYNTSSETYFRGEISTYSDATLKLYTKMVQKALKEGRNIVADILENTANMYGYKTLDDADRAYEK